VITVVRNAPPHSIQGAVITTPFIFRDSIGTTTDRDEPEWHPTSWKAWRLLERRLQGRHPEPFPCSIDSQSIKTATPYEDIRYDGNKKINPIP
jgi:hypothetical protein